MSDLAGCVRPATPADVPELVAMIRELAEFEKALGEAIAGEEQLTRALFAAQPAVFAHVAEAPDGRVAGMALWFLSYSTWLGTHGIHLEDLYVRHEFRRTGLGNRLLGTLAELCVERGYGRLEWSVLDWNESARGFYASLDADALTEWIPYRLTGAALLRAAGR
jgi:GNAT superfamily N-acetyltransferase